MTNQALPCREAFEKWAAGQGFACEKNVSADHGGEYETYDTSCAWEGWQAAFNTRAQSSAPEGGEAVAWMVERHKDPTFPKVFTEKERAISCVDMVTLPPFASIRELYTRSNAQVGEFSLLERIASAWDGCLYEGIGEDVDIGQAIREAALSTYRSNDNGTEGG